ncbi:uncharacterized protein IL334_001268 [Kwoniella shivajii]|uniref:Secreted protein n=1 Tax=Kwoniella shivajii TaxID=564305 RepID=A0ABZ1CRQ2_9TREE|nr:hypothetical protein IL334_001268 [Kwoniella shivajii]
MKYPLPHLFTMFVFISTSLAHPLFGGNSVSQPTLHKKQPQPIPTIVQTLDLGPKEVRPPWRGPDRRAEILTNLEVENTPEKISTCSCT